MRNNPWIPSSLPSFLSSSIHSLSSIFLSLTHSFLFVFLSSTSWKQPLVPPSPRPLPAQPVPRKAGPGSSGALALFSHHAHRSAQSGQMAKPNGAWRSCKACSFLAPLLCDHPPQPLVPVGRSPDYRFFPCSPSCPDAPCASSLPKRHHHHPIFHGHFLPQPTLQSVSRPFQVCHLWVF